jgi:hypothetical protein
MSTINPLGEDRDIFRENKKKNRSKTVKTRTVQFAESRYRNSHIKKRAHKNC